MALPSTAARALIPASLRSSHTLTILSVLVCVAMSFSFSIIPMASGLDPSFVYSFNHAAAERLLWGREFISTYGPYGYLVSAMDLGNLLAKKIVFSLVLAVGTGIAVAAYVRSVPGMGPGTQGLMTVVFAYAFSVQAPDYHWFALFVLLFIIGLVDSGRSGLAAHVLAGLLAGFSVLIKLSIGLGALMTLAFGGVIVWRRRTASRFVVSVLAATAGFLIPWVAAGGTLAGVAGYLTTGWEVSAGYSSAMSLAPDRWWNEPLSFLVWLLLVALWVVVWPSPRNRLVLVACLVPLFVAWKHSMVRQDEHAEILARFGVFVVAVLLVETAPTWGWRRTVPAVVVLLVPLAVPWAIAAQRPFHAVTAPDMVVSPFAFRGLRDLVRLTDFAAYRARVARHSEIALREDELPPSMKALIGQASVDVYPCFTSYVPANGLSWRNRPFPSSFNAYTPTLDAMNAAFFESPGRPEYLIWHVGFKGVRSIDGRYLLWDEPLTMRTIFSFYEVVAADENVILMRSRAHPRLAAPRQIGSSTIAWHTWVPVPETEGALLAEVSMPTSLVMRAVRTLFRDAPVFLSVRLSSGQPVTYRVVPDNMGSGLWLNPFATTFPELRTLLQDGAGRRVVAIRFDVPSPFFYVLSPSLRITWSQAMLERRVVATRTMTR